MDTLIKCPMCAGETSSRLNFCQHCDQQIKCLNHKCREELILGKDYCLGCGESISKKVLSTFQSNKYVHRVKQSGEDYEEYTELNISDHSVSKLAPHLVKQYISNVLQSEYSHKSAKSTKKKQELGVIENSFSAEKNPLLTAATASSDDNVDINNETGELKYFICDNDFLIAKIKDFKGKNWAEQQKRFILLYTDAYCQHFNCSVPSKDHLRTAANKSQILDSKNFKKYLDLLSRQYIIETNEGLKLNQDGEKEVKNIIANIDNDEMTKGYEYWVKSPKNSTNKYRFTGKEKAKIQEWGECDVNLGKLNINEITKPRDYAMLALWIITIHLEKAKVVRYNEAYHYIKHKYEAVSATIKAFSGAITNQKNEKYFRKTGDGYFLSPEGQKIVEGWIEGKSLNLSDDTENNGEE